MPNVTLTLSEEEQLRIEEILLDKDDKAALEFLKRIVKPRIDQRFKRSCKPAF
jgi:hypothetical protein